MSFICEIATASPEFCHQQTDILKFMLQIYQDVANDKRKIELLYKKIAIETRYSVLPDYSLPPSEWEFYPNTPDAEPFPTTAKRMTVFEQKVLPLALKAINKLQNTEIGKTTHLITVSCTGLVAPGLEISLLNALNLPRNTIRAGVNFMGCYAGFHALRLADAFCKSSPNAQVLIVDVELCTLHFQKTYDADNLMSNALFADGASAVVVKSELSEGGKALKISNLYSVIEPKGETDMAWRVGNTGFEMRLSAYIPNLVKSNINELLQNSLNEQLMEKSDIKHWAIHPGGKAILEVIEKQLKLPENALEASWKILRKYGNMSSVTIFYVLEELWNQKIDFNANEFIFACGFGPGLTMETAILEAVC
jgi:predicted naringenin-chalcone synthase